MTNVNLLDQMLHKNKGYGDKQEAQNVLLLQRIGLYCFGIYPKRMRRFGTRRERKLATITNRISSAYVSPMRD